MSTFCTATVTDSLTGLEHHFYVPCDMGSHSWGPLGFNAPSPECATLTAIYHGIGPLGSKAAHMMHNARELTDNRAAMIPPKILAKAILAIAQDLARMNHNLPHKGRK